jgi:hypothetical protein
VIQEDRIHDFARARWQTERHVRNSEHGANERNRLLDLANAFDGFDGAADVILISGRAREHQRIENDVLGVDAKFSSEQFVGALGNLALAFSRECLRLQRIFVDAADDHRRAVRPRQRAHTFELLFAVFQVDRVDDAFTLAVGERKLNSARIGGVDHDRRFDFANQVLVERRNVVQLFAIRALKADVHDMRTALHLTASDFGGFFPLFGGDEILEQP